MGLHPGLFQDETFAFYKNGNALPMGFAYDAYVTMEELEKTEESKRGTVLGARCWPPQTNRWKNTAACCAI